MVIEWYKPTEEEIKKMKKQDMELNRRQLRQLIHFDGTGHFPAQEVGCLLDLLIEHMTLDIELRITTS